ncbi:deoxyribonucleoside regulator [Roseiarcus fermentans]|uniref:Deoxyribonucleoside regulator n=1 Tax=Roseiarcus fermentans TaxID=1473586 RepID=A0A366FBB8_9HYPH|nr:sugar-binding transcriptional regulator [Roseiarcus fermentans]RBP11396.1 deoxyribonucleoside regulator [Roseiarcus fermentans]
MSDFDRKGSETARAAWLYYQEDRTQGEIAQELRVSRSTVTRLLQRAKAEGLVRISLNVTAGTFEAERALERAWGLERARIVPDAADEATQQRWLGHAAAELLVQMVGDDAIVAVAGGATLLAMADALVGQHPLAGAQVVAMTGGLYNATPGADANDVTRRLGQCFAAPARPLLAPVSVRDEATALGLANDPGVRSALDLARKASLAVYGFGAAPGDSTLFRLGHITPDQQAFLRARGAVGDIACRWIDRDGQPVAPPPSIHPIGLSLDELKGIPQRLAVGGGALEQEVIHAGVRGGFVTTLVTDERNAGALLAKR